MGSLFDQISTTEIIIIVLIVHLILILSYFLYKNSKQLKKEIHKQKDIMNLTLNYTSLIENYHGMAYRSLYDENWTMKYVSPKTFELVGYTDAELIDNQAISFEEIIHPKYRLKLRELWEKSIDSHEDFTSEYQVITKNKTIKWVYETGHAVYDQEGIPLYIEGFIHDITDEKESALRDKMNESKYENIIENSQDAIYIDEDGVVTYANPACVRFFKAKNSDDLIGKKIENLITEDFKDFYHERIERLKSSLLPNPRADYEFICFDGSIASAEVNSAPFFDNGKISIYVFIHDLTEKILSEKELKKIQKRNHDLIFGMTEGIGVFEVNSNKDDATLVYANKSFSKIIYGEEQNVMNKTFLSMFCDFDLLSFKEAFSVSDFENEYTTEYLFGDINKIIIMRFFSNVEHEVIVMINDITKYKLAEEKLLSERNRLETIIKGTNTATWEWNIATREIVVNSKWAEMIGYSYEELTPYNIDLWNSLVYPDDIIKSNELLKKHFNHEIDYYNLELRMKHKDGHFVWVLDRGCVSKWDESGNPITMSGTHQDISNMKEKEIKYEMLSFQDYLTGLSNRRALDQKILELENKSYLPTCIIMADVDGLKIMNDAFGHPCGDELLQLVSEKIKKFVKSTDFIARVGGDEFLIVSPYTTKDQAMHLINQIENELKSCTIHGIAISVSFGLGIRTKLDVSLKTIYNNAEAEMYDRKFLDSTSSKKELIQAILKAFFCKNPLEDQHSKQVGLLCKKVGLEFNLKALQLHQLEQLGLLHDIGKIAVNTKVLNKIEELSIEEWNQIKYHCEIGYRILSSSSEYEDVAQAVLSHHERWDGRGYPKGLIGEQIPWMARVIAVCEAYSAMTLKTPYKEAKSEEEAVSEIKNNAGLQFDSEIAKVFVTKVLHKNWVE